MEQQIAEIRIRGTVQGVGFRPCVWQLAQQMALRGDVRNDADGVFIRLFPPTQMHRFQQQLETHLPPLAHIDSITTRLLPCGDIPQDFCILDSTRGHNRTQVLPDIATCERCRSEIFDTRDRRHGYAFGNCTHCGPRYSIITAMPYDRSHTTMAPFRRCAACQHEYVQPLDRRFHAQPIACAECGPRLWLAAPDGTELARENAIAVAAQRLQQGQLLAIKATGGFHLACDASDPCAIERLRSLKHRPHKPLALMVRDTAQLRAFARVSRTEEQLLHSPAAPIVLLDMLPASLPSALCSGLARVGTMLPSTPLQHLLMAALNGPLVMTSGNVEGAPPCQDNSSAMTQLAPGVDALLLHNRDIRHRVDDSLTQVIAGRPQILRRARGYAPAGIYLPAGMQDADGILALGGDLKNAPCLLRQGRAHLAPHLGDMENPQLQRQLHQSLEQLTQLLGCRARLIACDPHPGYHSRRLAHRVAQTQGLPLVEVAHHHAHLAACLAEHRYPIDGPPVLGLILDGSGLAPANSPHPIWGGEILRADYRHCQRLDGLPAVALPGGDQAAREPWRNLLAHLERWQPEWAQTAARLPALQDLQQQPLHTLRAMIQHNQNAPLASSCGRLFDAVAALLGATPSRQSFEAQAAMHLEALAQSATAASLPGFDPGSATDMLDLTGLWQQLLDCAQSEPPARTALWFHQALARLLARRLQALAHDQGCTTLVLGGGCLQNRLLQAELSTALTATGFEVLIPHQVPANDGGLALGQAVVAWVRREAGHG
ncbi:carbamoyltransferase HypF [Marinobacterium rhizophilum]|uniref:Carbamoyltransferase HypF n=1 Tax=Marinobacterium rhizophilum TaxID=420402 RepID=A0ABY5HGY0_9GAMM|nr:carbamoyltransferase HypF [Marinobacterium rhizophilum]UTW11625.1 carbamoyltransferase HypF [Marinobacterium rhizophilum]